MTDEQPEQQPVRLADLQIVHSPLTVTGARFRPHQQPARNFAPHEPVIVIAVGRVGNVLKLEESDAGWLCSTKLLLDEVYDVDPADIADLLDRRRKETEATVEERFGSSAPAAAVSE